MLFSLFWTFFKIGLFTFGGGYAMIAHIKETVVDEKHWTDDDELTEIIAVAESTPGPIAINLATYVGYNMAGVLGSAAATVGVVIPAFIIMFIISLFLDTVMDNRFVAYAFEGIKCAVAFLILSAGTKMLKGMKKTPFPLTVFIISLAVLLLLNFFSVSFSSLIFIICGGILGLVFYVLTKEKRESKK
ncbi:MAG: chromate transporter [Ruminococcaceae bacterium]|nr:chromate transporter [Oscillospiraceae bacterium]